MPNVSLLITEQQKDDLIPLLTKEVIHGFEVEAELSNIFPITPLRGTDTLVDRVVGQAHVMTVDWDEADKSAQKGTFGSITYKVEQSIYIRHSTTNVAVLINDIDALKELGVEHGKALAIQRDATILTALLIGSRQSAMASSGVADVDAGDELDKTITEGLRIVLDADGDEYDVSAVEGAMNKGVATLRSKRKLDKSGSLWVVSHGIYDTLLESDKLVSSDFSINNGDYASGKLYKHKGIPVMPISVFEDLQGLVGVTNPIGDTWNTTAVDAEARAVLFSPRAIRVLEVMPVTVSAFASELHKQNYIDSQALYGVGVRRPDYIFALYRYQASQTATVGAGNEITSNVTADSYV